MVRSLRLRLTKPDLSFATTKNETRLIISPECWRATEESVEFWGVQVEVNVMEGSYQQPVKSRGIDPGHKFLQVFVDPFERERLDSGEDKASWRNWRSAFLVRGRLRGVELKFKFFEAGQHGEASDHRLG
jgi:hypothetical protein